MDFKGGCTIFYVNFKSRVRIFIMIIEGDRDSMGGTEPTWMYMGLPLRLGENSPTDLL